LWGGFQVKKWQIMAFVPYLQSRKVSDDGTVVSSGIGDASVLVNYLLISKTGLSANEKTTFRNDLWLGGGVKLPTGKSTLDISNPDFNTGDFNSQPGTGSIDYLANLTHNLSLNNSGIVTNLTYRFNSSNSQNFRFGDRFYGSMIYFHTLSKNNWKLRPNAGANIQTNSVNQYNGQAIEGSNGYILNALIGLNLVHGKWGILLQGFLPVSQNMYSGQTNLNGKGMVGLTYSL
jgi:hypothetical protein